MTCPSCVHNIESKLTSTKGILTASVTLETSKAQVQFNPDVLGARDIIRIVQVLVAFHFSAALLSVWTITASFVVSESRLRGQLAETGPEKLPGPHRRNPTASIWFFKESRPVFPVPCLQPVMRVWCLLRWKNSFLLSLVFGLPVMGLMIYMMVMDSQHQDHGDSMPVEQNLLPGLSLLNLAFFLLCTPVQVR